MLAEDLMPPSDGGYQVRPYGITQNALHDYGFPFLDRNSQRVWRDNRLNGSCWNILDHVFASCGEVGWTYTGGSPPSPMRPG